MMADVNVRISMKLTLIYLTLEFCLFFTRMRYSGFLLNFINIHEHNLIIICMMFVYE